MTAIVEELGQPAFRAAQLWQWLYVHRVTDWQMMTNLPVGMREELQKRYSIRAGSIETSSGDRGSTEKLLVRLDAGDSVEQVLLPGQGRTTVCISSQVGCKIGCVFCASGQAGFMRNLSAGEILTQIMIATEIYGDRPSNVVFMGIGEPMDNYDAVIRAIRTMNDKEGLNIGARKITISTSGLVQGIRQLSDEGMQIELSVSLHAPDNETRGSIMPLNRRYDVDDVLDVCRRYTAKTGRIITFEYTLIRNVNDSREQAELLAKRLREFPCRVNLIPLSPIDEYDGERCTPEAANLFIGILSRAGINATLRDSRGRNMDAACGQLRSRRMRAADAG